LEKTALNPVTLDSLVMDVEEGVTAVAIRTGVMQCLDAFLKIVKSILDLFKYL
jgi:hypothetical protein